MAIPDSVEVSEDQHAQHDTLRAFLTDQLSSAELRAALDSEPGYQPKLHAELSGQLGLSGWTIPEEFGGGQLVGQERAQRVMLSVLLFAEIDRVRYRHESCSCWPGVSCSQTNRSHSGRILAPAGISRVVAGAPRSVRYK